MEQHGLAHALEAMRAAYLGRVRWPLVFMGETGTGKTCAGLTLYDNTGGRYWPSLLDLCDEVREARVAGILGAAAYFWEAYEEANFVVLDEIGTHARSQADVSQHQNDCLQRAIDSRIDRRNPPLLLITNRSLDDIRELYGDTVASRMRAGTIVEFSGDKR